MTSFACESCHAVFSHLGEERLCPKCGAARTPVVHDPLLQDAIETAGADAVGITDLRRHQDESTRSFEETRPGGDGLGRLGRFELHSILGEGRFGTVYKAYDPVLDRDIALKIPKLARESNTIEPFLAEAKIAARLRHPNIVPVFDSGRIDQTVFIALAFIAGESLAARIDRELSTPDGAKRWLGERSRLEKSVRWVIELAGALEYAHGEEVVHRDLKPANILLDESGKLLVADFGLAIRGRLNDSDSGVAGTPAYMSPEQARGESVDALSDQYSLGVILYELITGERPFDGPVARVLHLVGKSEPVAPAKRNPAVSEDLDAICRKAMNFEKAGRYASVSAFAEDLHRYLERRTVAARPVGFPKEVLRWAMRKPALAGTLFSSTILLLLLAFGSALAAWLFRDERNRAVVAERKAVLETEHAELERGKAVAAKQAADEARQKAQELLAKELRAVAGEVRAMRLRREPGAYFRGMPRLRDTLARARTLNAPEDVIRALRDEMGNLLTIGDLEVQQEWQDIPHGTNTIVFCPKMTRYARSGVDGAFSVHERGSGKEISRIPVPTFPHHAVLDSEGGLGIVTTSERKIQCWDFSKPKAVKRWESEGFDGFFSPNGRLAFFSRNVQLTIEADAETGKEIRQLPGGGTVWNHPIHPTRPWIVLANGHQTLVVNYEDGSTVGKLPKTGGCSWHPTLPILALRNDQDLVGLWDAVSGKRMSGLWSAGVGGIAPHFDSTGERLVLTEWSERVRILDPFTGHFMLEAPLRPAVNSLIFGPNGESLAAGVHRDQLRIYRLYQGEGLKIVTPENPSRGFTERFGIDPEGRVVAIFRNPNDTVFIDAIRGRELAALPATGLTTFAWGNGDLFTFGDRGAVRWPMKREKQNYLFGPPETLPLPHANGQIWGTDTKGRVLAVPQFNSGALVWDRDHPEIILRTGSQHDVRHAAVSPDGRWVAAGSHGAGTVCVYDAKTGEKKVELVAAAGWVNFSPGGAWIAVHRFWGSTDLFRVGTWERVRTVERGAAWTQDDRLVAVGGGFGILRVQEVESGKEVASLETCDQTELTPLRFSPDSTRLYAVGRSSGALYIWDLRTIRARLKSMDADWNWPEFPPAKPTTDEPPTVRIELP